MSDAGAEQEPASPAIYTRGVRTALAAILTCLFAVMAAADGFACPDGCTDESPVQAATPHPSSSCAFCHGSSASPIVVPSRPAPRTMARVTSVTCRWVNPALPTIERPPKFA